MTGCDLGLTGDCTNWREGQRDSSNVCPGCGDEKCDPGFARTPYKHRTPCGEFDNWISEILNTTNIFCAAEIRSDWCCGGALTKWSERDYLSREGEQTVTVKQISLSFDRNSTSLVAERKSFCVSSDWSTQKIMDSGWHMWPWLINITSVSELHKLLLRRVSMETV